MRPVPSCLRVIARAERLEIDKTRHSQEEIDNDVLIATTLLGLDE
jgi:hypothetical protein